MGKMYLRRLFILSSFVLLFLGTLLAQTQTKDEVGLVIGATITPGQTVVQGGIPTADLRFNSSLALGLEYDRQLITHKRVALSGGLDFLASPLDVKLSLPPQDVTSQYAYVFLTPHVRLKFHPNAAFAPWLSFGGGYARFLEASPKSSTSFVPGTNTGTLEFGGGIDTRTFVRVLRLPIGFRFEVRDFYSGLPNYNQRINASLQNNVVFTGGFLIRF